MNELSKLPEGVNVPQGKCFFRSQNGEKGMVSIEIILFGGDIFGTTHKGYIPYIAEKTVGFHENIESHPTRYQGLVNCLIKGLIPYGQRKSSEQLGKHHEVFIEDLEFLYGHLGDIPEILEIKGKKEKKGSVIPQNISLNKLLQKAKELSEIKKRQKRGEQFAATIIEILDNPEMSTEAKEYIESAYRKGNTPKGKELRKYGISEALIYRITQEGTFSRIQAIVSGEETILGEKDGYELVEMHSITHLEEETSITGHCVGNSNHYIKKINEGKIRIFSLRKGGERVTIEYGVRTQKIEQIEGHKRGSTIPTESYINAILLLEESGIQVNSIDEKHRDKVGSDTVLGRKKGNTNYDSYMLSHWRVDLLEMIQHNYASCHEMDRVIFGNLTLNENDTYENLIEIFDWDRVVIDTTNLPQVEKDKIIHTRATLKDSGESVHFQNLVTTGDSDISQSLGKSSLSLPKVERIEGSIVHHDGLKSISMPSLTYIGGELLIDRCSHVALPKLKYIGGIFSSHDTEELTLPELETIGDHALISTKYIYAPKLKGPGGIYLNGKMDGDISGLEDPKILELHKKSNIKLPGNPQFEISYRSN